MSEPKFEIFYPGENPVTFRKWIRESGAEFMDFVGRCKSDEDEEMVIFQKVKIVSTEKPLRKTIAHFEDGSSFVVHFWGIKSCGTWPAGLIFDSEQGLIDVNEKDGFLCYEEMG